MAPSSWHCTITYSEISHTSRFRTFWVRLWCIGETMMSLQGNSLSKLGKPLGKVRFHIVTCVLTPKSEVMIPVLFKTLLEYRFHPLPHPLPLPLLPHPLSTTPSPTIWPPLLKVNRQLKIVNYFTCTCTSFVGGSDPQKLIWIDTQGSLTHIVEIFKFGNVSGPRATKWPKVNCLLKIVNYFTCMQHFFCRWQETQKLIWIDTQGSVTHIAELLNFADASGPRPYYTTKNKWHQNHILYQFPHYFWTHLNPQIVSKATKN